LDSRVPVFLVVGDTARNPARSGIQTVVRSLAGACAELRASVRPVIWNARRRLLRPLPPELALGAGAEPLRDPARVPAGLVWRQPGAWLPWLFAARAGRSPKFLSLHQHPLHRTAPRGSWVLLPELMYKGKTALLVDYVHRQGWRLAALFYDTIPVDRPDLVPPELPASHRRYMRELTGADLILPISEASASGWRAFVAREHLPAPQVRTCALACDFVGTPRVRIAPDRHSAGEAVRMLCVSTLEPRKNHLGLLAAYERLVARRPDLRLELDLVGAPYVGSDDIVAAVRAAAARLPGLRWHAQVEYERLQELFARCDFTVYPSLLEGFGLPVIESLWLGKPCICADFGVMAENAAGGGCLTTDVRDPDALAHAIATLAESPELRARLTAEAIARPLKSWGEYTREVLDCLASAA
jgi:glycosyltransferase involved in cell wall biosynthesis